ncbi:MAG: cytidylate kinase-like family protein [Desulfobacterales bacterium]|jgi:cytidylate kinase
MAVITISRGSYSRGKEIAEKVAAKLGYHCISRDLLLEVSKEYNIPELKLVHAVHDAPGILKRLNRQNEKYIAFIKAALLEHLKADNIVYHGLAGHFFVKNVPHALKVRVLSDMEDRIRLEKERRGIDTDEARRILEKDDKERQKWSQSLYGIDTTDPILYDLVVHIKQITVEDAVDIICRLVSKEQFKTTPESQRLIEDLALSAAVQKAMIDIGPDIEVCVDNHIAYIETEAAIGAEERLVEEIRQVAETFEGISDVKIECHPIVPLSE